MGGKHAIYPYILPLYPVTHGSWQKFCVERKFEDGTIVTEAKVCIWLRDDIFLRRVPPPKGRKGTKDSSVSRLGKRKRGEGPAVRKDGREREEEKELARQLGVSLEDMPAMLEDDRAESDIDDDSESEGTQRPGTLYRMNTIDAYCAAIAELYQTQRTNGVNCHPTFRGPAFKGLVESRGRLQDQNNREDFTDRGLQSLYDGYTTEQFLHMQECLLQGAAATASQVCSFYFL